MYPYVFSHGSSLFSFWDHFLSSSDDAFEILLHVGLLAADSLFCSI